MLKVRRPELTVLAVLALLFGASLPVLAHTVSAVEFSPDYDCFVAGEIVTISVEVENTDLELQLVASMEVISLDVPNASSGPSPLLNPGESATLEVGIEIPDSVFPGDTAALTVRVDGQEYDDGVYQGAATLSTTDTSISICAGSPYDGETTTFVVPHGACPNGGDPDYFGASNQLQLGGTIHNTGGRPFLSWFVMVYDSADHLLGTFASPNPVDPGSSASIPFPWLVDAPEDGYIRVEWNAEFDEAAFFVLENAEFSLEPCGPADGPGDDDGQPGDADVDDVGGMEEEACSRPDNCVSPETGGSRDADLAVLAGVALIAAGLARCRRSVAG